MIENIITQYFEDIKNHPKNKLLTHEEEINLAKRIENGDKKAKEELIVANLKFVVSIVKNYSRNQDNFLDFINEGNKGLIEAAERFDYRKGVRFSTCAVWWIKQKILKHIKEDTGLIRVPGNGLEKIKKLEKLKEEFSGKLGYTPKCQEFVDYASNYFKMDDKQTRFFLEIPKVSFSLNEKADINTSNDEFIELIEDDSKHFTTKLEEHCFSKIIREKINELPKQRWKEVIKMRYGIFDESILKKYNLNQEKINQFTRKNKDGFSLENIGYFLGLTKEGVRRIEKSALGYMKEKFVEDPRILKNLY